MSGAVPADDEPCPALARELVLRREVEVPRSQDLRSDPDMSEIRVVALEQTLASRVHTGSQLYSGIPIRTHPIAECEFEIAQFLVAGIDEVGLTILDPLALDRTVNHRPS